MLTKHITDKDIENLILICRRQGTHYTAQTILWELDEVLKKSKYIPLTISLMKIRKKIVNTDTKETNLKEIYQDILYTIDKNKTSFPELSKLQKIINALLRFDI